MKKILLLVFGVLVAITATCQNYNWLHYNGYDRSASANNGDTWRFGDHLYIKLAGVVYQLDQQGTNDFWKVTGTTTLTGTNNIDLNTRTVNFLGNSSGTPGVSETINLGTFSRPLAAIGLWVDGGSNTIQVDADNNADITVQNKDGSGNQIGMLRFWDSESSILSTLGLSLQRQTSATNSVQDALTIRHLTTGTPANNIGLGLLFEQETSSNNYKVGARIDVTAIDTTPGSEDFGLSIKTMSAGSAAVERVNINSVGDATFIGDFTMTNATPLITSSNSITIESTGTGNDVLLKPHLTGGVSITPGGTSPGSSSLYVDKEDVVNTAIQFNAGSGLEARLSFTENNSGSNKWEIYKHNSTDDFHFDFGNSGSPSRLLITSAGILNLPVAPSTANTNTNLLSIDGSGNVEIVDNQLRRANVTLNDANFMAIDTSPFTLVAAPGSGKYIHVISAVMKRQLDAGAFTITTTQDVGIGYNVGTGSILTLDNASVDLSTSTDRYYQFVSADPAEYSGAPQGEVLENTALVIKIIKGGSISKTGGGSSGAVIHVVYTIEDIF